MLFFDWKAEIDKPVKEELDVFDPSDLESWNEIPDYLRKGRSEYFVEIRMLCYMASSHHTLFAVGPQQKRK